MNSNFLTIPFPCGGAVVYMSLAEAGDMGANTDFINENRRYFFKTTGLDSPDKFPLVLKQVHSHIIFHVDELAGHEIPENGLLAGDGIISGGKRVSAGNRALGVSIADCVPIFLYDKVTGAYGAFHSGWRGTGIVSEGVNMLVEDFGAEPGNIQAVIGPSIGGCCYQVGKEVYDYFLEKFGSTGLAVKSDSYFLDLKTVNRTLLEKCGLKIIVVSPYCTCCNKKFFSYRRTAGSVFPRMLAYIRILE